MLSYPLQREFRWKWFPFFALGGGFIGLAIIIVVNVVLTGFETVTVLGSDYRVRQTLWYDRFVPTKEPASLCDTRVFNTGDSFTTNYTIFAWTLGSVILPNAGNSGLAYNGTALTDCDISSLFITGDLRTWTIDFVILISCSKPQEYDITATTRFSISNLPGSYFPPLGVARYFEVGEQADRRAKIVGWLIQTANNDLGNRVQTAFLNSGGTNYVAVSVQVDFQHCPASLGPKALCGINTPSYNISQTGLIYPNGTLSGYSAAVPLSATNQFNVDPDISGPLNNIIRIIHATTRMDLGVDSPNNFILHPEVSNVSLTTTFPITHLNPTNDTSSSLLSGWAATPFIQANMPVNVSGPAELQVVYLCRLQQWKPAGQLFISVLVATLSVFSSGWAIFITVAAFIARHQDPTANVCEGHRSQPHEKDEVTNSSNSSQLRRSLSRRAEYEPVENERVEMESFDPVDNTQQATSKLYPVDNVRTNTGDYDRFFNPVLV